MKRILLAGAAVVLGAGSAAWASEPVAVSVSGYGHFGIGFKSVDETFAGEPNRDGFGIMRDGEIHFDVRGTSDNGLTFSGRVELEAFSDGGDQIDRNWFAISGGFGEIKVGSDKAAAYNMATGLFFSSGGKIGWYDDDGESNPTGAYVSNDRFGDPLGIFYNTPEFAGFQAQVSYHPRGAADGPFDTNGLLTNDWAAEVTDVFSIGLNYGRSVGDFDFRLSAGYDYIGSPGAPGLDDDGFSLGAQVGFSGFIVGGFFKEGIEWIGGGEQEYVFNVGYETGPWLFVAGVTYADNLLGVGGSDLWKFGGAVDYQLAPGVVASLGLEYTTAEGVAVIGPARTGDLDGFAGMTWLTLNF